MAGPPCLAGCRPRAACRMPRSRSVFRGPDEARVTDAARINGARFLTPPPTMKRRAGAEAARGRTVEAPAAHWWYGTQFLDSESQSRLDHFSCVASLI